MTTDEFRADYRSKHIGKWYSGGLHFAYVTLGSLAIVLTALSYLRDVRNAEWLTIPVAFVVANFVEWLAHQGPMHHRTRLLGLVFRRHTLEHHRFFTHEAMPAASRRDFKMVLFPPVLLVFFLLLIDGPLATAVYVILGRNVAALFVATTVLYYMLYEVMHTSYHLPTDHWMYRALPFMHQLRLHHTTHHDPKLMAHYNFNITFPIADRVCATYKAPTTSALTKA